MSVLKLFKCFGRLHTAMIKLPRDFKEFLKLLNSHHVDYLLIGGYAVSFYGYVRPTSDLDIWIDSDKENIRRTVLALEKFGFPLDELSKDIFADPDRIVRMGMAPIRIEIMSRISGVDFRDCYKNRKEVEIDGTPITLLSLDDLRVNKKASGRLKDLADLEQLS